MIANQTVVITNDVISEINKSKKIKIPENTTAINGSGKYLLLGLVSVKE